MALAGMNAWKPGKLVMNPKLLAKLPAKWPKLTNCPVCPNPLLSYLWTRTVTESICGSAQGNNFTLLLECRLGGTSRRRCQRDPFASNCTFCRNTFRGMTPNIGAFTQVKEDAALDLFKKDRMLAVGLPRSKRIGHPKIP